MSHECSGCEGYRVSKVIEVAIRTVYGEERIYPVCEQARLFANLAGTKTLTRQRIDFIKSLGYTILVEQKQVAL